MTHGKYLPKKNARHRTNSAAAGITSTSRKRLGWEDDGRRARVSAAQRPAARVWDNRAAQERINGVSETPRTAPDVVAPAGARVRTGNFSRPVSDGNRGSPQTGWGTTPPGAGGTGQCRMHSESCIMRAP